MIQENQIPKISLSKLKKSEAICFKHKIKYVCVVFTEEAKAKINKEIAKIYAREIFIELYNSLPENYKTYEDYQKATREFWMNAKKYKLKDKPVFKSKVNKNNIKIVYYKTVKPLRILYDTKTTSKKTTSGQKKR